MSVDYNYVPYHRRTLRKVAAPLSADQAVRLTESTRKKGRVGEVAGKKYDKALALANNPNFNSKYIGMTRDEVQKLISKGEMSGAELARIDASQLTSGQNYKALKHQLKGQKYNPKAMLERGWKAQGEGGGGYMAGTRMGRYVGAGGKSLSGIFAVGDLKDAANKADPTGQGRSRTERLSYGAGGLAGGVLGGIGAKNLARVPGGGLGRFAATLGAGIGGLMGGYYVGGKAGKYIDRGVSAARGVDSGDRIQSLRRRAGFKRNKDGMY